MGMHPIKWQAPVPLWSRFATAAAPDQSRPAILRFASDDFMEQMIGTLARDPAQIGNLLARPETWRTQMQPAADLVERVPVPRVAQGAALGKALARPKSPVPAVAASADLPLKLYQPAHQRYYLVAASLVCGIAGMPDRSIAAAGIEQIGFVLRRMLPATPSGTALREFAFVKDESGARWRRVANDDDAQLAPGEEILPLFPLNCRDEGQRARTLWTGFVPVARREEYVGAAIDRTVVPLPLGQLLSLAPLPATAPTNSKSARMMQFKFEVAEPWKNLVVASYSAQEKLTERSDPGQTDAAFALNLQWQMQSWLILLDFADYLEAHLRDLWTAINDGVGVGALTQAKRDLYDRLGAATMSPGLVSAMSRIAPDTPPEIKPSSPSLREALKAVRVDSVRKGLEQTELLYNKDNATDSKWPAFHFLLAGINSSFQPDGPFTAFSALPASSGETALPEPDPRTTLTPAQLAAEKLDRLTAAVVRALDSRPEPDAPPASFALKLRDTLRATSGDPGWFAVRCVYFNRDCGPLHPPVLSAPTQRFQLANFFDPDAPARPVRITLPTDTTPAGLRKHNKNTAFVISDLLCGQIQRAKGLGLGDLVRSVLPFPFHRKFDLGGGGSCKNGGGDSIGMICSLSIPIITICALILLMIIVTLLDLIFRWRPFFMLCLPVPGLKGKK